jgi:hypothetical protein
VSCFRNPLNNSRVIPGKLGQLARPGIQENRKLLDTRFRGYDGGVLADLFCELRFQDTRLVKKSPRSTEKIREIFG